jgi:hypothetical protein
MFRGIAAQRSSGLSPFGAFQLGASERPGSSGISRSADLESRTTGFDRDIAKLRSSVAAHHGEFEDLRTENRSGQGRVLAAAFSVPAGEFGQILAEVKALGRVQHISEVSEDSSVKAARLNRQVSEARANLARLQSLQQKSKAGIQDALALQKEITKATEDLAQVENEQQNVLSTVARAAVRLVLVEDYRATLDVDFAGALLELRNSFVGGIDAIHSSLAIFLGVLLEYGLPVLFWTGVLYYPVRLAWKKLREVRLRQSVSAPAS